MSDALILQCTFTTRTVWGLTNIYTCTPTIIAEGDPQIVTEIRGNHVGGRTNADVFGINIDGSAAANALRGFAPRGLANFFPNLQAYTVINAGVAEITREDLRGLRNLRQLQLNGNLIRVIPRDLLADNPLVSSISFNFNPLRHVAHYVFDHLPNLASLHFDSMRQVPQCHDEIARNRPAVLEMIFHIARNCPPTSRMIAEEILNEDEILGIIDRRIEANLEKLEQRILQVELMFSNQEPRISKLEREMKTTIDNINFLFSRVFPQG